MTKKSTYWRTKPLWLQTNRQEMVKLIEDSETRLGWSRILSVTFENHELRNPTSFCQNFWSHQKKMVPWKYSKCSKGWGRIVIRSHIIKVMKRHFDRPFSFQQWVSVCGCIRKHIKRLLHKSNSTSFSM